MDNNPSAAKLNAALAQHYAGSQVVTVHDQAVPSELLLGRDDRARDSLDLYVFGNEGGWNARLIARLDNLGKGASGAAIQNLNIMCGLPETTGLRL